VAPQWLALEQHSTGEEASTGLGCVDLGYPVCRRKDEGLDPIHRTQTGNRRTHQSPLLARVGWPRESPTSLNSSNREHSVPNSELHGPGELSSGLIWFWTRSRSATFRWNRRHQKLAAQLAQCSRERSKHTPPSGWGRWSSI